MSKCPNVNFFKSFHEVDNLCPVLIFSFSAQKLFVVISIIMYKFLAVGMFALDLSIEGISSFRLVTNIPGANCILLLFSSHLLIVFNRLAVLSSFNSWKLCFLSSIGSSSSTPLFSMYVPGA